MLVDTMTPLAHSPCHGLALTHAVAGRWRAATEERVYIGRERERLATQGGVFMDVTARLFHRGLGAHSRGAGWAARRLALLTVLLLAVACGPVATTDPRPTGRSDGQVGGGLAYGSVRVEAWRKTIIDVGATNLEVRHRRTQARFRAQANSAGDFVATLPAGPYAITSVWSGFHRLELPRDAVRFAVLPATAVYVGALEVRRPSGDRAGGADVVDELAAATARLQSHPALAALPASPVKGLMFLAPASGVVVSALIDDRVLAPFIVDTGAAYTTLTRKVSSDLGVPGVDRLSTQTFRSLAGEVTLPVTRVASVRVEDARVTDVEVAIDVTGRLPAGLLGATFLRHFKVTVDRELGDIRLER